MKTLKLTGEIDFLANELREEIINAEDKLEIKGKTYYVSSKGNDSNDGASPEFAIATIGAIENLSLEDGDAVLLERGSIFRTEKSLPLVSGVTYGAYGTGAKPIIYGSPMNYAQKELWNKANIPNVWYLDFNDEKDAGVIVFNCGQESGFKMPRIEDLKSDLDFFHSIPEKRLYLYLEKSAPYELFEDIEIGVNRFIFSGPCDSENITINNIALKYTGGFGIRFGNNCKNISVSNCEISWIGGSYLNNKPYTNNEITTRWGNAIEFWVGGENLLVENCYIYQCYDAGVTYQVSRDALSQGGIFKDVIFRNNLLEYNTYNIEFFVGGTGSTGVQENILIENNIMRFAGYGYGYQRPDKYAVSNICAWKSNPEKTINFKITNNIFDCSRHNLVCWYAEADALYGTEIINNTFYQWNKEENALAMWFLGYDNLKAVNQEELEKVVKLFDKSPKLVKWIEKN